MAAKQQHPEGYIRLTLANPLTAKSASRLGLDNRAYAVKEEVWLHPDRARELIGSGYAAGVNPQKPEQVREAMKLGAADPVPVIDGPEVANAMLTPPAGEESEKTTSRAKKSG